MERGVSLGATAGLSAVRDQCCRWGGLRHRRCARLRGTFLHSAATVAARDCLGQPRQGVVRSRRIGHFKAGAIVVGVGGLSRSRVSNSAVDRRVCCGSGAPRFLSAAAPRRHRSRCGCGWPACCRPWPAFLWSYSSSHRPRPRTTRQHGAAGVVLLLFFFLVARVEMPLAGRPLVGDRSRRSRTPRNRRIRRQRRRRRRRRWWVWRWRCRRRSVRLGQRWLLRLFDRLRAARPSAAIDCDWRGRGGGGGDCASGEKEAARSSMCGGGGGDGGRRRLRLRRAGDNCGWPSEAAAPFSLLFSALLSSRATPATGGLPQRLSSGGLAQRHDQLVDSTRQTRTSSACTRKGNGEEEKKTWHIQCGW